MGKLRLGFLLQWAPHPPTPSCHLDQPREFPSILSTPLLGEEETSPPPPQPPQLIYLPEIHAAVWGHGEIPGRQLSSGICREKFHLRVSSALFFAYRRLGKRVVLFGGHGACLSLIRVPRVQWDLAPCVSGDRPKCRDVPEEAWPRVFCGGLAGAERLPRTPGAHSAPTGHPRVPPPVCGAVCWDCGVRQTFLLLGCFLAPVLRRLQQQGQRRECLFSPAQSYTNCASPLSGPQKHTPVEERF